MKLSGVMLSRLNIRGGGVARGYPNRLQGDEGDRYMRDESQRYAAREVLVTMCVNGSTAAAAFFGRWG